VRGGLPPILLACVWSLGIALLVVRYGFGPKGAWGDILDLAAMLLVLACLADRILLLRHAPRIWPVLRSRKYEFVLLALLVAALGGVLVGDEWVQDLMRHLALDSRLRLGIEACELFLLASIVVQSLRYQQNIFVRGLRPEWILIGSFALLILIGSLLLLLPRCASDPQKPLAPVDAVFTSTSAVCVTGLVVRDTGKDFTVLGQFIILLLFQTGGLGIITFVAFIAVTSSGSLPLANSVALRNLLSATSLAELKRHVRLIVAFTLLVEFAGAAVIFSSLPANDVPVRAACWSLFHSVSAFCNAGFALQADSLVGYRDNVGICLAVMALIILGGLGFLVLNDVARVQVSRLPLVRMIPAVRRYNRRLPVQRLSLQSRLSFVVTALLLVVGFVGFWILEGSTGEVGETWGARFWAAAFQSVTSRTAGFNTVDIGHLQLTTLLLVMALMVIGACPVSTGGGIKTVTFGVLVLALRALLLGRDRVEVFGRALPQKVVFATLSVTLLYVAAGWAGTFALAFFDPQAPLHAQSFEVISALSTVGLSTGITAQLSTGSKLVLCLLMFVGRVGPLSLVLCVFRSGSSVPYRFPDENVVVG